MARIARTNPEAAQAAAEAQPSFWSQCSHIYTLAALLAGMTIFRFVMFHATPGPPGSDGGNWLAFSTELFGGKVKAADGMYFPVMLVLLKLFTLFTPPLLALKTLGILASVAMGVPFFYLVRRSCSVGLAAVVTFCLLVTGYQLEMLTWGGYPQLLASSFMLTSLVLMDEGLTSGSRSKLLWAAGFGALVAGTHHFTFLMYVLVIALYAPAMLWRNRADIRPLARRFAIFAGAGAAFSLVFVPWYLEYVGMMASGGSLNANGNQLGTMSSMFSFVYTEAPLTWMTLMIFAPILAFAPFGRPDGWRLRHIGLPLVLGSAAFFMASHEARIFQTLQIGVLLCLGAFAGKVEDYLHDKPLRLPVQRIGYASYGLALVGLVMLFGMNGFRRFDDAISRYRALDDNAIEAMDWVRSSTPHHSLFLTGGRDGWVNYSWWLEGYGKRPSLSLVGANFLAFKQEREQAALSDRIIAATTPASEVRELMDEAKVDYLFIYKPSGGAFQNVVSKVPVYVSHENDTFVVLKVRRDEFAKMP